MKVSGLEQVGIDADGQTILAMFRVEGSDELLELCINPYVLETALTDLVDQI